MRHRINTFLRRMKSRLPVARFLLHNRRVWGRPASGAGSGPQVLVEQNQTCPSIIATSYLARVLAARHQARLVAYSFARSNIWLDQIYRSFGCESLLHADATAEQRACALRIFDTVYPTLRDLRQVESLEIGGVWIGDLVYDEYLRQCNVPTIDTGDQRFVESLRTSLCLFVFWRDYFSNHDVRALAVSHCVYKLAIPLRLAVQRDIPVYQINATHVYRLTKDRLFAYTEFKSYPELFSGLPPEVRKEGIAEAQRRIRRRFEGEVGVDMAYSRKSAYAGKRSQPVLRKSDRIKVLIAPHSFVDAPHAYGENLFPDFYAWMDFLGKISETTDYDWYVKTHPDCFPVDAEVVAWFVEKYPRFTLLPADTSHHQIIGEGINFALTIHGTIGFEYAALGVPVINGSPNNPHAAYGFNIHPKSLDEYQSLLRNLAAVRLDINVQEVFEYYFMHNMFNTENWLFKDYRGTSNLVGNDPMSPRWFSAWMREWSRGRHREIIDALEAFAESGEFRLGLAEPKEESNNV